MPRPHFVPTLLLASTALAFAASYGCRETQSLSAPPSTDSDLVAYATDRIDGRCPSTGVEILQNGGFEDPRVEVEVYAPLSAGDAIGAWTVDDGAVDLISGRYWRAAEKRQSLDLDGSCGMGTISQVAPTVPGRSYQLCFAMAGNPDGPPAMKTMEVWWGDQRIDSLTFDTTGATRRHMGWTYWQYAVTATGSATRLRFTSLSPGCYGPTLDDVRLQEIEAPIP
jgi:choice-of-anchor C domain-containing protein